MLSAGVRQGSRLQGFGITPASHHDLGGDFSGGFFNTGYRPRTQSFGGFDYGDLDPYQPEFCSQQASRRNTDGRIPSLPRSTPGLNTSQSFGGLSRDTFGMFPHDTVKEQMVIANEQQQERAAPVGMSNVGHRQQRSAQDVNFFSQPSVLASVADPVAYPLPPRGIDVAGQVARKRVAANEVAPSVAKRQSTGPRVTEEVKNVNYSNNAPPAGQPSRAAAVSCPVQAMYHVWQQDAQAVQLPSDEVEKISVDVQRSFARRRELQTIQAILAAKQQANLQAQRLRQQC